MPLDSHTACATPSDEKASAGRDAWYSPVATAAGMLHGLEPTSAPARGDCTEPATTNNASPMNRRRARLNQLTPFCVTVCTPFPRTLLTGQGDSGTEPPGHNHAVAQQDSLHS